MYRVRVNICFDKWKRKEEVLLEIEDWLETFKKEDFSLLFLEI